jgi:hypothetical protein
VSAVTPAYAYLGRTVDLTIAGSETSWTSATTVAFADTNVKVNKVTAASATGLLVNVTIGAGAALAATDVTVTTGTAVEVYKGAFQIKAPITVAIDQSAGVPQGGFANVDVQMLDVSTPLDANTADITLGVADVNEVATPNVTDFALTTLVGADVLATPGESVDLTLTSGSGAAAVTSPAKAAFKVAARTPKPLTTTTASGMIQTTSDSALFQFAAASAAQTFVQLNINSPDGGGLIGLVVPKSGKLADSIGTINYRFGLGTTSTDTTYLILTDGGSIFANPPPYGYTASVTATACTAVAGPGASMHLTPTAALSLATLPALVTNDYGDGTNMTGDWYSFTVGANKTIHAATGGDGVSDMMIAIYEPDGTTQDAASMEDDYHKDITDPVTTAGTYFVQVTPGMSYDPTHSTYELFVEVK